jgi:hypothetical protein
MQTRALFLRIIAVSNMSLSPSGDGTFTLWQQTLTIILILIKGIRICGVLLFHVNVIVS